MCRYGLCCGLLGFVVRLRSHQRHPRRRPHPPPPGPHCAKRQWGAVPGHKGGRELCLRCALAVADDRARGWARREGSGAGRIPVDCARVARASFSGLLVHPFLLMCLHARTCVCVCVCCWVLRALVYVYVRVRIPMGWAQTCTHCWKTKRAGKRLCDLGGAAGVRRGLYPLVPGGRSGSAFASSTIIFCSQPTFPPSPFAFLCVDSTRRSETGLVWGLRWHNRPREWKGNEW